MRPAAVRTGIPLVDIFKMDEHWAIGIIERGYTKFWLWGAWSRYSIFHFDFGGKINLF
jgi:hypothetical protein